MSEEQFKLERKVKQESNSTLKGLRNVPTRQRRQALEGSSKVTVKDGKSNKQGDITTIEADIRASVRKNEDKKTFTIDTRTIKNEVFDETLDSSNLSKNKIFQHGISPIDVNKTCRVELVKIESTLGRNEYKTKSMESENMTSKVKVESSKPVFRIKSVDRILVTKEKGITFSKEQLMKKFGIKDVSVNVWKTPLHNVNLVRQSLTGQTSCDINKSNIKKVTQSNLKLLGQMDLKQRITTSIGGLTASTDSSIKAEPISLEEMTDHSTPPDESLDQISSRSYCSGRTDDEKSSRSVSPQPSTSSGFIYIPRKRTARKTFKDNDLKKQYSLKEARVLLKSLSKIELALLKNPHSHFGKGNQSGQDSDDGQEQNVSLTSLLDDVDHYETDINEDSNSKRDKGKALFKKSESLPKGKPQPNPRPQQSNTVDADLLKKFGITRSIVVIKQSKTADDKLATDCEIPTNIEKNCDVPPKDDTDGGSKRERGVITIVVGKGKNLRQTKQTSPEKDISNTGLTSSCSSSNDGVVWSSSGQPIGISPRGNKSRKDTNVTDVICKPFSILLSPIDSPKKKHTNPKIPPNGSENMHNDYASIDCEKQSESGENAKDEVEVNSVRFIKFDTAERYERTAKNLNKSPTNRGVAAEAGQRHIEEVNEIITKGESDASKMVLSILNSDSAKSSDREKVLSEGNDPKVDTQYIIDGDNTSQDDNETAGSDLPTNSDKMEVEFENQSKLKMGNVGERSNELCTHAHVNDPLSNSNVSRKQPGPKRPAPEIVNSDQSQKKQRTSYQRDLTDPPSSDNSSDIKENDFTSESSFTECATSSACDQVGEDSVRLTEPKEVDSSVCEMKESDDIMDTVNVLSYSMVPCAGSSCSTQQAGIILLGDKDPFACFEDNIPELKSELNEGQLNPVNEPELELDLMANQNIIVQDSVQQSVTVRDSDEQCTDIQKHVQNSDQVRDSVDKHTDTQKGYQSSNEVRDSGDLHKDIQENVLYSDQVRDSGDLHKDIQKNVLYSDQVRDSGDLHKDIQESVLYSDQVRDSGDTITGDVYCSDNTDASIVQKIPSSNDTIDRFNKEDSAVNKDTFLDDILEPAEVNPDKGDMSPDLNLSQESVQSIPIIDNMSDTAIGDICFHQNQSLE